MKKLLFTGATGFFGKNILPHLSKNYDVTTTGRSENIKSKHRYIQCDLSKEKLPSKKIEHWDVVIHAAGKAHVVPKTEEERKEFFDVNLKGTKNLAESLEESPPKAFIFISTIAVYGLEYGMDITEDAPLNAKDPYGLSKIEAEQFLTKWANKHDVNLTILRLPLVAGSDAPGNLGAMIKGIQSGKYLRIGEGATRKSMVWAEDIAYVIPDLENVSGVYNLTDGQDPSFKELEDAIASRLDRKVRAIPKSIAFAIASLGSVINFVLRKRAFPLDRRAYSKITKPLTVDDSKARREFGWNPRRVVDMIKKTGLKD